jgi:hypothetical protein
MKVMNQLERFSEKHGLQTDKKQIWGQYKGYQFTIGQYSGDNILTVFTSLAFEDTAEEQKLDSILEGLKAAKEIKDYKNNGSSLSITKTKAFGQVSVEELEYLLDRLANEFSKIGARPACFNCNNEGEKDFACYNGVVMTMCDTCYASISENLNQAQGEYEIKSSNYLSGAVGAILGALLGSVLWVVIGMIGYIASIAGLAISAASTKGYMLLNGKMTKLAPWIIGLASLIALILAQFVTLDITFYNEFKKAGYDVSITDTILSTFELPFIDPEVTTDFFKNMGLGLLFAALGAFSTFRRLSSTAKAPAGSLTRAM